LNTTHNKHIVIKCHRCGTSKGIEDKGIFAEWRFKVHTLENMITVWFHSEECFELWKMVNHINDIVTHEYSEEYGITKTLKETKQ
jgi:hypothetical protein